MKCVLCKMNEVTGIRTQLCDECLQDTPDWVKELDRKNNLKEKK